MLGICFELLVAPIKPELAVVTVLRANADASTCGPGTSWSDAANRCLVNASTAQTQRDLEACAKLSTPEEQKACYEKNANKGAGGEGLTSGDIQAMYKGNSFGLNVAKTAVYALPLMLFGYMMVKKKMFGSKKCLPPSTIAMMVASVTMLGGEVYGFIKHKSNLKKLDEAREKLFTPKTTDNLDQKKVDATQMQSEAFQLLSDEQKSIEDLAKTKKIFYGVAASAFAAAAGIAAYEMFAIKAAKKALITAVATESARLAGMTTSNPQYATTIANIKTSFASINAKDAAKLALEAQQITAIKTHLGTDEVQTNNQNAEGTSSLMIDLDKLNAQSITDAPAVAKAASNYKNLLVKFECWEREPASKDPIITSDFSNPAKKNIPLIQTQINNIRNADSIDDVLTLSQELESMFNGQVSSNLDNKMNLDIPRTSEADKLFGKMFANITADHFVEKYSIPLTSDSKENSFESKILAKLQSEFGISSAHAKGGGALLAILPTAGMLLMSSNLLKGKDKSSPNNTSNGNNTATGEQSKSGADNSTVKQTDNKFQKFIQTPKFRIAFGGVLGVLTGFMTKEMADQQKIAKARKETLLKLKGDFENTQGMKICTPAERNDQSQPGCYCYTAEGSRNPARGNSAVCQNMWNSIALNNNSYLASSDSGPKVCITQSNQVDQSCSCRTSNTCLKASGFNISGISIGSLSTLGSGLAPINTVASGNGAELNADGLLNNAFKLREATNKILKDKDMKNENAIVTAAEKNLGNFIGANTGTIGSPSTERAMPTSLANFDAKAALEDLKEEVESSNNQASTPGAGIGFDTGSSEPTLEFGLTEEEAAVQEQQVAEVLQQDMDLGSNDISGSSTNLFEVLSHRYQRSGMRRLFDTEGKTEADKPAETDINK